MEFSTELLTITVFGFIYLTVIIRNINKGRYDLYDFFFLSSVVSIPFIFLAFPNLMQNLAFHLDVEFPFVIMFGVIFLVVFVYLHRLIGILNKLDYRVRTLAQKAAQTEAIIDALKKSNEEKAL
jgi:hypothetical protein